MPDGLIPPSITICASKTKKIGGWKKSTGNLLEEACPNANTIEQLYECIDDGTFTLNETVNLQSTGRGLEKRSRRLC